MSGAPSINRRSGLRSLVVDTVRASMAIPVDFKPVRLQDADGKEAVLVDGGARSNFALDVLDRRDPQPPRWPTLGVKILPAANVGRVRQLPCSGASPAGPLHLLEPGVRHAGRPRPDAAEHGRGWRQLRRRRRSRRCQRPWRRYGSCVMEQGANGRARRGSSSQVWDFAEYRRRFRI